MSESQQRTLGLLLGAYLFVLWGELLLWSTEDWQVHPSDVLLAAALGLAGPTLWRARCRARDPIILLAFALAASLVASTLAAGDGLPINIAGRLGIQLALVVLGASIAGDDAPAARPIVARAAIAVAIASSAVTLGGGVLGVTGALEPLERWIGRPAFVDRTGHPLFGDWPRFVGGFSYSAEICGLWACVAAATLRAARRPVWWLAVAAAIGTLAIGGAAIVGVLAMAAPRRLRVAALAIAALAILAIQVPVHHTGTFAECATWPNHRASRGDTCMTRYALAKVHAVELFREHPVLGSGASGFRRHAGDATNPYYTPHGAWHGVAAEQGVVGLALALALALVLARSMRAAPPSVAGTAVAAALVSLLAASLDLDVHKQRVIWMAIGVTAGLCRPARASHVFHRAE